MPPRPGNRNAGVGRPRPRQFARGCTLRPCSAVWLLLRFGGDRWWFATVILFGPRWLCALPLAMLVPAAAIIRRRLLSVLAATAIMVFGPVMGFCIPRARLTTADGPSLRVLTCNVKGKCYDNATLDKLIEETCPTLSPCRAAGRKSASAGPRDGTSAKWPISWLRRAIPWSIRERTIAGAGRDMDRIRTCSAAPCRRPGGTSIFAASICSARGRDWRPFSIGRRCSGLCPTLDAEIEQRRLQSEDACRFVARLEGDTDPRRRF